MSLNTSRAHITALLSLLCLACNAAGAVDKETAGEVTGLSVSAQISQTKARYTLLREQEQYPRRASVGWQRQRPGAPEPAAGALADSWVTPVITPVRALLGRSRFDQEVMSAARQAGLDPALVHAVIRVESAYRPHAISPKGAVGLMQVIPSTGRRFGIDDLLQPTANISAGTQYLSYLMRMFEGDLRLVLAAYNAGENAVLRHGRRIPPYLETQRYVPRVLSTYHALSAQNAHAEKGAPQ